MEKYIHAINLVYERFQEKHPRGDIHAKSAIQGLRKRATDPETKKVKK